MENTAPLTQADVDRADQTQVTPSVYANATFEGVQALRAFAEDPHNTRA